LNKQKNEVYKAKRQLFDQRKEYNKILTADARNEHLMGELIRAAGKLPAMVNLDLRPKEESDEYNEALLFLSDWHVGLEADNIWNRFNQDILQARVSKLVNDSIRYLKRHKPKVLHIAIIGDMVHGVLHNPGRIASSELGVEQLMQASEIIADVVNELSMYVEETLVYSTYGNHARSVQNYKDSIHSDNLERLIPWWMKQRLKGIKEIKFVDGIYEFLRIRVCGQEVGAVHGDLDSKKELANVMTAVFDRAFGVRPKYVAMGHIHHTEDLDANGVRTIVVSSLCGTEEFANTKRFFSTPSQTLLFFNMDGLECRYDITFND
jgi:UDP-2,3-diacylglucosamine pyrophosphatase LpxH